MCSVFNSNLFCALTSESADIFHHSCYHFLQMVKISSLEHEVSSDVMFHTPTYRKKKKKLWEGWSWTWMEVRQVHRGGNQLRKLCCQLPVKHKKHPVFLSVCFGFCWTESRVSVGALSNLCWLQCYLHSGWSGSLPAPEGSVSCGGGEISFSIRSAALFRVEMSSH